MHSHYDFDICLQCCIEELKELSVVSQNADTLEVQDYVQFYLNIF